jgi:hypothetical protein
MNFAGPFTDLGGPCYSRALPGNVDNRAMPPTNGEINRVSDTPFMVGASRALKTDSQDGFVPDPFAARLAGERGMAIPTRCSLGGVRASDRIPLSFAVCAGRARRWPVLGRADSPVTNANAGSSGCSVNPWRVAASQRLRQDIDL